MSTLKESLIHRRVGESPSAGGCYSADDSVPALLIHAGSGELWVLPWSHFVSARHKCVGDREQVTLLFATHEVELQGVRLASLLPEIAGFHLGSLRSLPAKYEPQGSGVEPFIERLSVTPIGPRPSEGIAASGGKKPVSSNDSFR
ncbi:MAG: hypothetical protein RL077_1082 [Verrucomicrobiota bacterium]|jgi:hypothetical protein